MNAWFDQFSVRCAELASRHRAPIEAPHLNAALARELLDLTREVAHTGERQFAPLAAFVVGESVARMLAANPSLENDDVVAFVQELKQALPPGGSGA
jgi:hypothetical protein